MKFSRTFSLLFIFSISVLLSACNSSSTNVTETPPALPPSEVMESDFDIFTDNEPTSSVQPGNNETESPYSHFLNASARALILNGTIKSNLFLPATILAGAEAVEPELNDDGDWEWNYSVSGNSETFSVSIVAAEQTDGQTSWSVFISNSLINMNNELLFEGISSGDNGSGTWTVYRLAGFGISEPHIQLEWEFDSITRFSVGLEFLQEPGFLPIKTILTERDGSDKRTVSREENGDLRADISWKIDSKQGSLIAPNYNEGEQACWDGNFMNTECD